MTTLIYKVLSAEDWASLQSKGIYEGSPVDLRDGYVHLSAAGQLAGTLSKHYAGRADLRLLAVDPQALPEGQLRWEVSRGGERFPHLYAPLPLAAVRRVWPIDVSADGSCQLPEL